MDWHGFLQDEGSHYAEGPVAEGLPVKERRQPEEPAEEETAAKGIRGPGYAPRAGEDYFFPCLQCQCRADSSSYKQPGFCLKKFHIKESPIPPHKKKRRRFATTCAFCLLNIF